MVFPCENAGVFWLTVIVAMIALSAAEQPAADGAAGSDAANAADQIRRKWSADEVVRDLEHIKRDVSKIMELQLSGDISRDEMMFYYFRMHDFDNNHLLDGHELMAAMRHTTEHEKHHEGTADLDELIGLTDSALAADTDHDGFLSYPEIRNSMNKPV